MKDYTWSSEENKAKQYKLSLAYLQLSFLSRQLTHRQLQRQSTHERAG